MIVIVNLIVIVLIVTVAWFFFVKKEEAVVVAGKTINILVNGGYQPKSIQVKKDQPTTLIFERTDPTDCLEEVVIPDLNIREYLPLNQKKSIAITPTKAGILNFHCGMSMYYGKIKVV